MKVMTEELFSREDADFGGSKNQDLVLPATRLALLYKMNYHNLQL